MYKKKIDTEIEDTGLLCVKIIVEINKHGYIREHVKIFEDYYKCCMLDYGVVHHIN